MTLRPPQWPGKISTYRQRELSDVDVDQILKLWDQGIDTWQIYKITGHSQASCERALHVGLERRYQAQAEKGGREEDKEGGGSEEGEEDQGHS
jgi:hypothetical protein